MPFVLYGKKYKMDRENLPIGLSLSKSFNGSSQQALRQAQRERLIAQPSFLGQLVAPVTLGNPSPEKSKTKQIQNDGSEGGSIMTDHGPSVIYRNTEHKRSNQIHNKLNTRAVHLVNGFL